MLCEYGRRSFAEIAKSLDQSESTARFWCKTLIDRGVIRSVKAHVNPGAVESNGPAALFTKANALKRDVVLRDLCSLKEVPHICRFTGDRRHRVDHGPRCG